MRTRISNETGPDAAFRNWGRLALALIPAALGLAAIWWAVAAFGWFDFARMRRIEERTLSTVGISAKPTAPVVVTNYDAPCLKIESSFMDGRQLVFYARNTCQQWLTLPNFSYRVKAHDGTVIDSRRYAFDGDKNIGPRERREQRVRTDADDRIERVELHAWD